LLYRQVLIDFTQTHLIHFCESLRLSDFAVK
jgi:hypothetical protein